MEIFRIQVDEVMRLGFGGFKLVLEKIKFQSKEFGFYFYNN